LNMDSSISTQMECTENEGDCFPNQKKKEQKREKLQVPDLFEILHKTFQTYKSHLHGSHK
ncbi:hypothetical protein Ocin01_19910, partial [Orchesella cincta]